MTFFQRVEEEKDLYWAHPVPSPRVGIQLLTSAQCSVTRLIDPYNDIKRGRMKRKIGEKY